MKPTPKQIHNALAMLSLLFIAVAGFPQTMETENERPKVALVLSGGGAKGLAHIGVIKVLEEHGIKPDIITGTSMGSIVGSLYAAGYSAEEMTAINHNADWEALLTDDVSLRRVAMNVKPESKKYLFTFPIRDKKMQLPLGLIEGQHLEAYFSELFWGLTSEENFNDLPIPFHCMSVDLISGNTIEHQTGNLVKSIRASMAIPSVFSPVEHDSMLLVDGGVTRNFPVQEAIDMGADIVIGVYVGFDESATADRLNSLTDILSRSVVLGGIIDAREQFKKCDILIIPDLGEYGAGDFEHGKMIQHLGEESARLHEKEIEALVDEHKLTDRAVEKIEQPEKVLISGIEVENLRNLTESAVISRSGIQVGDSVDHKDINEAIEYMYGTTHFRGLSYALKEDTVQQGAYLLVFEVKENPRTTFNLAANFDDDLGVGLVSNFTLKNIISPASRLVASLNIAENPGFSIYLDKKLGKKQRFTDHYIMNVYSWKLPYYEGGERLGRYKRAYFETGYGIDYTPGLNHQIGGRFFYRYNRMTPDDDFRSIYEEADFEKFRTHEWAYRAFYKVNTTDDLYFPKKGIDLEVSFTHAFYTSSELDVIYKDPRVNYFVPESDEPYATLFAEHNWYKTFAKRVTYHFSASGGFNGDNAMMNGMFLLGGVQYNNKINFKNFAGFNFGEIIAPNFAMAKSGLRVELTNGLYFSGTVNLANVAETYDDLFDNFTSYSISDYVWGYNLGFKYDSILGPIQLLVSDNNKDGETRFHFSIGFPF